MLCCSHRPIFPCWGGLVTRYYYQISNISLLGFSSIRCQNKGHDPLAQSFGLTLHQLFDASLFYYSPQFHHICTRTPKLASGPSFWFSCCRSGETGRRLRIVGIMEKHKKKIYTIIAKKKKEKKKAVQCLVPEELLMKV